MNEPEFKWNITELQSFLKFQKKLKSEKNKNFKILKKQIKDILFAI